MFVRINGETHYLWRAVDHEGEVLEVFVTKRRDRKAALKFLRKTMKRYGRPEVIVTDRLRSYRAAMNVIGNAERQATGRWINNRAENSHQPFRRRERAMASFRSAKSLQKFTSIHSSVHNHFSQMDPSRKSGGALHRLHCFCLEFDGACEVQRRVPTDWIIEPVDVSGYGSFSLAS